jgi:hypothetical protein
MRPSPTLAPHVLDRTALSSYGDACMTMIEASVVTYGRIRCCLYINLSISLEDDTFVLNTSCLLRV